MIDKVTTSPFGTAGETSEEPWPGEDGEKCEKSEKEDGNVDNEESVERKGLNLDGWSVSRAGGDRIVRLLITARRHRDLSRLGN
jgi:hypothetical protein